MDGFRDVHVVGGASGLMADGANWGIGFLHQCAKMSERGFEVGLSGEGELSGGRHVGIFAFSLPGGKLKPLADTRGSVTAHPCAVFPIRFVEGQEVARFEPRMMSGLLLQTPSEAPLLTRGASYLYLAPEGRETGCPEGLVRRDL